MAVLEERAQAGLHEFTMRQLVSAIAAPGARAVDLGCGSGAFTERLVAFGCDAIGVDYDPPLEHREELTRHKQYGASAPYVSVDLNDPAAADRIGRGQFDLVTCIEVVEHLENPCALFRTVASLLRPTGAAVITTPNVDSVPARMKFFLKGTLRMMDDQCDPSHISPIFLSLLTRHLLPRAHLRLDRHEVYPPQSWMYVSNMKLLVYNALAAVLPGGRGKYGDVNVYVLRPA